MNILFKKAPIIFFIATLCLIIAACTSEACIVRYEATEGGSIVGEATQSVEKGNDASTITAVADDDYIFVGWSDGETNATRQDTNIQKNITLVANFEKKGFFLLSYGATEGGFIEGKTRQHIMLGNDADSVTAVAVQGFVFTGWSDGETSETRLDTSVTENKTLTANFELKTFVMEYVPLEGGSIRGAKIQSVTYGNNAQPVTAVPLSGYVFSEWSDGSKKSTRQDINITADAVINAQFRKLFDTGKGTLESPYAITTYQQFLDIKLSPDSHYRLENDLDLRGKEHKPLFDSINMFNGSFDGCAFTISGLTITEHTENFSSLFGFIGSMGSVQNLILEEVSIVVPNFDTTHYPLCIGMVAGVSLGLLSNITVSGQITGTSYVHAGIAIGGIVGQTQSKVENCHANITISLSNFNVKPTNVRNCFGGLIGVSNDSISNCTSSGSIEVTQSDEQANVVVGGLVGYLYGGGPAFIACCEADTEIFGNGVEYVGGFVGMSEMANAYFSYCGAKGNVSGEGVKGGGFAYFMGSANIANCFAEGDVVGTSVGGFANSLSGNIVLSYASGDVTSLGTAATDGSVAGFSTYLYANIAYCYATGNVSGTRIVAGFVCTFYGSSEGSFGLMEACYSTGSVSGLYPAGLIQLTNFTRIRNCYSTSDVHIINTDETKNTAIGGIISVCNHSFIENCYYTGKITGICTDTIVGGIAGIVRGEINNCYWLGSMVSIASRAVGQFQREGIATNIHELAKISDFYLLADALNLNNEDVMWVDVPDDIPCFVQY